jgi:hypothetical protein
MTAPRRRNPDRTVQTLNRLAQIEPYVITGLPHPKRYTRKRWHCTIRKPRTHGEEPFLVRRVIWFWVHGQSCRWIGSRFGLDRETIQRWVEKHPELVRQEIEAYGGIGITNAKAAQRMGVFTPARGPSFFRTPRGWV